MSDREHRMQVVDKGAFYTTEQLGKTRFFTPEGYLVCVGVPIARTGTQLYQEKELNPPGETILKGDANGIVRVKREESEVFNPETMASAEGKSITIEHPPEFVTPENHKLYEVGHMQHVRRGEGEQSDLLVADWIIKDPIAIKYANEEFPEVSSGYDAGYRQEKDGEASQHTILINHGAMVRRGRAGPRVAIQDHNSTEVIEMAGKNKGVLAAVLAALGHKTEDAAKIVNAVESLETGDAAVHTEDSETLKLLKSMDSRLKGLEDKNATRDAAEAEAKAKDEAEAEEKRKAEDAARAAAAVKDDSETMEETGDTVIEAESAGMVINLGTVYTGDNGEKIDAHREVASRVEIIAPGTKVPTADALKGNKGKALAGVLRQALTAHSTKDAAGAANVKAFLIGRTVDSLSGSHLLGAFNGVAALAAAQNNARQREVAAPTTDAIGLGKMPSIADMNAGAKKFWPAAGGETL